MTQKRCKLPHKFYTRSSCFHLQVAFVEGTQNVDHHSGETHHTGLTVVCNREYQGDTRLHDGDGYVC